MLNQLYESQNVSFSFNNETNVLYEVWKVCYLEEEVYIQELLVKCDIVKKYKPAFILDDVSMSEFALNAELQTFTEENLIPIMMEVQVQKHAFVMSEDIFFRASIEQLSEDAKKIGANIRVKYFQDAKKAEEWLLAS